jgi:hypothetical protein
MVLYGKKACTTSGSDYSYVSNAMDGIRNNLQKQGMDIKVQSLW